MKIYAYSPMHSYGPSKKYTIQYYADANHTQLIRTKGAYSFAGGYNWSIADELEQFVNSPQWVEQSPQEPKFIRIINSSTRKYKDYTSDEIKQYLDNGLQLPPDLKEINNGKAEPSKELLDIKSKLTEIQSALSSALSTYEGLPQEHKIEKSLEMLDKSISWLNKAL